MGSFDGLSLRSLGDSDMVSSLAGAEVPRLGIQGRGQSWK